MPVAISNQLYVTPTILDVTVVEARVLSHVRTSPIQFERTGFGFTVRMTVSRAVPQFWLLRTTRSKMAMPLPVTVAVLVGELLPTTTAPLNTFHEPVPLLSFPANVKMVVALV